jgi:hypothetical protein
MPEAIAEKPSEDLSDEMIQNLLPGFHHMLGAQLSQACQQNSKNWLSDEGVKSVDNVSDDGWAVAGCDASYFQFSSG